jgi:hypothetical protein
MRKAGYVLSMSEKRNAYRISFEKPDGERSLRRLRRKWEDNIKMALRYILWGGMDWIHLAEDGDQWGHLYTQ